jgi:hypothetical protein
VLKLPTTPFRDNFNPVDVRCAVTHNSVVLGAEVQPADLIAHEDENVGLLCFCLHGHHSLHKSRYRASPVPTLLLL